jgi:hypothetical protein
VSDVRVVHNVRPGELQSTIVRQESDGWRLEKAVSVSGAGHIGVTFTVIFRRNQS